MAIAGITAGCFPSAPSSTSTQSAATPVPAPSVDVISTAPVYVAGHPAVTAIPVSVQSSNVVPSPSTTHSSNAALRTGSDEGTAAHRQVASISNVPKILAINISTLDVHSGDAVSGNVHTTNNVKSVEIRISAWSMPMSRAGAGYFVASGQIPQLPVFVKGNYTLQVIARNSTGLYTERDIPITLR